MREEECMREEWMGANFNISPGQPQVSCDPFFICSAADVLVWISNVRFSKTFFKWEVLHLNI